MLKKFSSVHPPALARLNGVLKIIPTYVTVPDDTTLEDVLAVWEPEKIPPAPGYRATDDEINQYRNGTYEKPNVPESQKSVHKTFEVQVLMDHLYTQLH